MKKNKKAELEKLYEEFGRYDYRKYVIDPYKYIKYGRKSVELFPGENMLEKPDVYFIKALNDNIAAKGILHNFMLAYLSNKNFKIGCIPKYEYIKVYKLLIGIYCGDKDKNDYKKHYPEIFDFIGSDIILTDVILYALANAQTVYNEYGTYTNTILEPNSIMISASRLLEYSKDYVVLDGFGKASTMYVRDNRIYKNKNLIKIIINDYDEIIMKMGRRVSQLEETTKNNSSNDALKVTYKVDPNLGLVKVYPTIEL